MPAIDDSDWFEQHPGRRHRIRLCTASEIRTGEIVHGQSLTLPTGIEWFTAVRLIDGVSERFHFGLPVFYVDLNQVDEALAREAFEHLAATAGEAFADSGVSGDFLTPGRVN